jgi:DNA-binding NarL/FixJ family response regulator
MLDDHVTMQKIDADEPWLDSIRVILIDDDQGVLDLYKRVLGAKSNNLDSASTFELELCSRGDLAIEAVRHSVRSGLPFAVAFVDIVLPDGPDGYETAARMRDLDPALEIVFVTGYPNAEALENARGSHPKEKLFYIQKPFSVLELRQLVIALSAKWQAEKRLRRAQSRLEEVTRHVMETNQALSTLAQNIQKGKEESDMRMALGIRSKVLPILKDIRTKIGRDDAVVELDMLESYMKELTSNLTDGANVASSLTPSEMRIACMIKNGFTNQEIADQMFISVGTVKTHRKNIRRKLDIRNSSQNLRTYLKSNMDGGDQSFFSS